MGISQDQLISERRRGLGGSDSTHYLKIPPYGCPRKCWYQRSDVPPDYPGDLLPNKQMQEGTDMETPIAEEWSRRTGRPVVEREVIFHPTVPHLLVHIDREIEPVLDYDGPGVLEIKSLSPFSWRRFEENGLFEGYLRQMQHALMVTGWTWGAFAIHRRLPDNPETGRSLSFDVPMAEQEIRTWDVLPNRDQQNEQRWEAARMWGLIQLGTPPDPLPRGSKPCSDCAWREHCQGAATAESAEGWVVEADNDEQLISLQREFRDAKRREREAKAAAAAIKAEIDTIIGRRGGAVTEAGLVKRVMRKSRKLDVKALMAAHPELVKGFTVESTTESLKVK